MTESGFDLAESSEDETAEGATSDGTTADGVTVGDGGWGVLQAVIEATHRTILK